MHRREGWTSPVPSRAGLRGPHRRPDPSRSAWSFLHAGSWQEPDQAPGTAAVGASRALPAAVFGPRGVAAISRTSLAGGHSKYALQRPGSVLGDSWECGVGSGSGPEGRAQEASSGHSPGSGPLSCMPQPPTLQARRGGLLQTSPPRPGSSVLGIVSEEADSLRGEPGQPSPSLLFPTLLPTPGRRTRGLASAQAVISGSRDGAPRRSLRETLPLPLLPPTFSSKARSPQEEAPELPRGRKRAVGLRIAVENGDRGEHKPKSSPLQSVPACGQGSLCPREGGTTAPHPPLEGRVFLWPHFRDAPDSRGPATQALQTCHCCPTGTPHMAVRA